MLSVLYISSVCSPRKFDELYKNSVHKPQQQAQKFHNLLIEGLMNSVDSLYVLSRLPISNYYKAELQNEKESYNHVTYDYLRLMKNPFLRHISILYNGFIKSFTWNKESIGYKRIVICDVLNLTLSFSSLLSSKIFGTKSVAIVTDIPDFLSTYSKENTTKLKKLINSLYRIATNYLINRYDYYIVLTEEMNELVNPYKKPYIVIEGMVDNKMVLLSNELEDKYEELVIIYAGALNEKYGVKKLIEAFKLLDLSNARLWLYGSGDMNEEMNCYENEDSRVKYFGVLPNELVVKEQIKATLLVNPRPSNEEFTKYSFPSKNMEYMVSGTPTLTTQLKGMPKDHTEFVYLFQDETIVEMAKMLDRILKKNREELHEKGLRAKEFALREKSNRTQAEKILKLIEFL